MKWFLLCICLSVSLIFSSGGTAAQDPDGAIINADGDAGASNAGINPAVDADGPTIVYGDLYPGPGTTVIGPPEEAPGTTSDVSAIDGDASALGPGSASASPGTVTGGVSGMELLGPDGTYSVSDTPPSNVSVGESGAPLPAPEPAVEPTTTETAAPVNTDTTVATGTDLDGDNYADALEIEVGLDPNNVDTDGDGVADGDEVNIYGTDPFTWDVDGDGVSDGDELFNTRTDPLVWDAHDGGATNGGMSSAAVTEAPAATEATTESAPAVTGVDGDSDRLADADEAAVGTDPASPDSDGDGYYDGDEANLGTDPLDPSSLPTA
jgi:hypothetical protein